MERLTNKKLKTICDGYFVNFASKEESVKYRMLAESAPKYEEIYRKLAEYEDKQEQGLLIELPISVYFIMNGEVFEGWVQEAIYSVCRKPLYYIRYDDNSLKSFRGYLGNEVFLTRSEAEEALAKMGGK